MKERYYELPDGQVITIGSERFRATECMFQPSLLGMSQQGLHDVLFSSIMRCDKGIRKELFENVVMNGGCTLFYGFRERIENELKRLAPASTSIKVIVPEQRLHSVWIGGSLLSTMSSFEEMWISKDEYDEFGPSIVHQKCV